MSVFAILFAKLFPTETEQREIVRAAGLNGGLIAFDAVALVSWSEILRHSELQKGTALRRLCQAAADRVNR